MLPPSKTAESASPGALGRHRDGPEKPRATSGVALPLPTTKPAPTESVADGSGGKASSQNNYHGKLSQQKNSWYKSMTVNPGISLFVLNFWPTAAGAATDYQEGNPTRC